VAKLLLKHGGVNANSKDKNGATPLFWAASREQKVVVQLLLDQEGVDADSTDNDGMTALSLAAITMHAVR
jgi:ankyrin repeat protein